MTLGERYVPLNALNQPGTCKMHAVNPEALNTQLYMNPTLTWMSRPSLA